MGVDRKRPLELRFRPRAVGLRRRLSGKESAGFPKGRMVSLRLQPLLQRRHPDPVSRGDTTGSQLREGGRDDESHAREAP